MPSMQHCHSKIGHIQAFRHLWVGEVELCEAERRHHYINARYEKANPTMIEFPQTLS